MNIVTQILRTLDVFTSLFFDAEESLADLEITDAIG